MEIAREEAGGGPRPARVDALNPATAAAWRAIRRMPEGLVLYGGTAVAPYLGHRESRDRYANSSMIRRPSSNRRGRRSRNGMFGGFKTGNQWWSGHRDAGKYLRRDVPASYEELGNGGGSVKACFVGEFFELAGRAIPIIDELQGPGGRGRAWSSGRMEPARKSERGSPEGGSEPPRYPGRRRSPRGAQCLCARVHFHMSNACKPRSGFGASGRRRRRPTRFGTPVQGADEGISGQAGRPDTAWRPAPGAEGFDIVPRLIDAPGGGIFPRYRCGSELTSPRRRAFADTSRERLRRGAPWRRPPPRPCLARRWTVLGVDFTSPRC